MKFTACFTGGGTAGHVFPAIAIINSFKKLCEEKGIETKIFWIGSSRGMEKKLVESEGIEFYSIPTGKLRRYFSLKNFTDLFKIAFGILSSIMIIKQKKPDIVFSKGGYVTVPPVLAAHLFKIPVITHESDYTPGLATRINKRFSKLIMLSFKDTARFFEEQYQNKLFYAGNPVREIFYNADAQRGRKMLELKDNIPVIMVIGGSLGAREINSLTENLLPQLLESYYIIHQTGKNAPEKDFSIPEKLKYRYKRFEFIGEEIADYIAASDIVLSRAGAGLIWEIAAIGKPLILIPLRGKGTRGDQIKNAQYIASRNAALVLDDEIIEPYTLYNTIKEIIENKIWLNDMEKNIKSLSLRDSANSCALKLIEIAGAAIE